MKILNLLLALLLLPLASSALIVNTYTNDFSAGTPYNEQLKLCACETKTDTITVENTGQFVADFTVHVQSDYPGRIKILTDEFTLAPHQFQEITILIEDSCALLGTYGYDVEVRNIYGRSELISRSIRVDRCQTVALAVTPEHQETGTCEPVTYTARLENLGPYDDTYTITHGDFGFPSLEVFVPAGETKEHDIAFTFRCDDFGTKEIPFIVSDASHGVLASTTRTLTIRNDYAVALSLPESVTVCAGDTQRVAIGIANQGPPEDYALTLDAPAFASLDKDRVMLERDQSREATITIAPGLADVGSATLRITAQGATGGVIKTRDVPVTVRDCASVDASVLLDGTPVASHTACCGSETFMLRMRNAGDVEQTYSIAVDGPSWLRPDERTVRLAPGQEASIPLTADIPCTDEDTEFLLTITPLGGDAPSASVPLRITSATVRACYEVGIEDDELFLTLGEAELPLHVQHVGLDGGAYALSLQSDLFTLTADSIDLAPGEDAWITVRAVANLTPGRYILQPTFTHDGVAYIEHVGVDVRGPGPWAGLVARVASVPWGDMSACAWTSLALILVLALALLALLLIYFGAITPFADGLPRGVLTLLRTLLLVLILIGLVALPFLMPDDTVRYERAPNSTATRLEWYQGTALTLDLASYFEDPDADALTFTASQPAHVRAAIDGSVMTLTPDEGWAGQDRITVTASDPSGESASSPELVLTVIPCRSLTTIEWLNTWCRPLNDVLLVALAVVLFLFVLTLRERRPNRPNKNVLVVVPAPKAAQRRRPAAKVARAAARVVTVRSPAPALSLVASKTGNTVHTPYCMIARRIPRKARVAYTTKEAALKAGLVPCKGCRPF